MMSLLRTRTMMKILVGICILGLVVTGAVGLITARDAPQQPPPQDLPGGAQDPGPPTARDAPQQPPPQDLPGGAQDPGPPEDLADAPELNVLGSPPDQIKYSDLGEECDATECGRVAGVESADLDGDEAIDTVYTTLLDGDFALLLPPGEEDPEGVDWEDAALTNSKVVVQGSPQPAGEDDVAHLVILNAQH
ncbi:hypothetical protein RIF23_07185 [Lipingzhangella sp. LS1_29]|uniref:Uncharacterized protein n=1 Tax=Lipingzhangella rawalii TaxID=2055835 RepID=A0ABU2H435_9ACTN|nr:hypothetical protein [Lipingzhangella rawalii]MDS1270074.1 hypothetical protein [Lipingzhangella rawalii]